MSEPLKYFIKRPGQPFKSPAKGYPTFEAVKIFVEHCYRAGHTGYPWIQVVREDGEEFLVVAEWKTKTSSWINPYEAAGFGNITRIPKPSNHLRRTENSMNTLIDSKMNATSQFNLVARPDCCKQPAYLIDFVMGHHWGVEHWWCSLCKRDWIKQIGLRPEPQAHQDAIGNVFPI